MKRIGIIAIILIIIGISFWLVYSLVENPHDFSQSECTTCHFKRPVKKDDPDSKIMVMPVSMLCERCHRDLLNRYNHPIDVIPVNAEIPPDMPLSYRGVLTCSTCHDIHSPAYTPFGGKTLFLRRFTRGRLFCIVCHKEGEFTHKTAMTEVHMKSKYFEVYSGETIDPLSANCISCHDGSYATSVPVRAGIWQHGNGLDLSQGGNHPIGVDYEAARMKPKRKTDLRPMAMVDPRIKFFNGKIGCGSCHDPFSDKPGKLVMSNEESRLCYACHYIDK